MKATRHGIFDLPVISYFLLMIFAVYIQNIVSGFIDLPLGYVIPGYGTEIEVSGVKMMSAYGIGLAAGALLAALLFYLIFYKEFNGILRGKYLLKGLLMMLPFLVFHWAGSIVSIFQFGASNILIALLRSTGPGFGEEVAFRGLGIANYLRKKNTDKGILTIFWLSSIVFGAMHITNMFAGAPFHVALSQAAYATGCGMLFCAVYLRTGNLWTSIIGHTLVDFPEYCRGDLGSSAGIMLDVTTGDYITYAAGAFAAIWALYLIRRSRRQEIIELWDNKWKKIELPAG